MIVTVVINLLAVAGAAIIVMSAVAMVRGRDAYMRISALSPAVGLGLPLIVVAAWWHDIVRHGFGLDGLIRVVFTVVALLIVSSVGSNLLTRAAFLSGAPVAPGTRPNDLMDPPEGAEPIVHEPDRRDLDEA